MYRVIIVLAFFLAFLNFLIIQTQTAAYVSLAIVLVAVLYGVYQSPKEKRLPVIVFIIVAVPLFLVLGSNYE